MDGTGTFDRTAGFSSLFQSREPSREAETPGLRILVCEDNPINQKVVRLMLELLGHASDLAANGEEALAATEKRAYDLIFMDCQMPGLDGYEATRRLRARPDQGRPVVVIAMTAHAMEGDRERCLAAGMDDYLPKPLFTDSLRNTIARWSAVLRK